MPGTAAEHGTVELLVRSCREPDQHHSVECGEPAHNLELCRGATVPGADGQTCWYWGLAATYQTLVNGYYGSIISVLQNPAAPITASVWPWRRRLGTARGEPETSRAIATIRCRRHELVPTAPSQSTGREASAPLARHRPCRGDGPRERIGSDSDVGAPGDRDRSTRGRHSDDRVVGTLRVHDHDSDHRVGSAGHVLAPGTTTTVLSSGTALAQKQPPWGGYRVNVPPVWHYVDKTIPSDHITNVWTDPATPGQRLTVVASGCIGCVMYSLTDRSLIPPR